MSRGTKRGASKVPKKRIEGVISVNRRGIGYLAFDPTAVKGTPKTTEDIEVSTDVLKGALNGDTVEVELTDLFPRPKGKVVKIVERAKEEFICTLTNKNGTLVAIPADLRFYKPITLMDASKYAEGEKVLVRLISFDGKNDPTGTIVEHLGRSGEHRVEMNAIVMEHGFSTSFPPEVEREAQQIEDNYATIIAEEIPKRMDFRESTTFTIDPKDAKDFDDALSVEALPNGEFEIGVHIADATFFCVPGTAIDDEAVKRGTSVYLVDATIPMLPHQLSGNVCSLKADEDRLAFSAIFRMNKDGEVLERKFAKTVIRSNRSFTYEEAQDILNEVGNTKVAPL